MKSLKLKTQGGKHRKAPAVKTNPNMCRWLLNATLIGGMCFGKAYALPRAESFLSVPDSTEVPKKLKVPETSTPSRIYSEVESPDSLPDTGYVSSFISVQQILKGRIGGLYVQEPNGEPGALQNLLLRGVSVPLFSKQSVSGSQPAVYVNGIPIICDHPFSSMIQSDDVNPLGTATNVLAGISLKNILSVKVIKDPLELAKLGPLAANGAIWIITKNGWYGGKHFSLDFSMGIATPPSGIQMSGAGEERLFRSGFYEKYGLEAGDYFPAYLKEQGNSAFFGGMNWADSYYRSAIQYNVDASIGGGSKYANYLFTFGILSNGGVADNTGFNRYNMEFYLNMNPLKGFNVGVMLSGSMFSRDRNRSIRDRYAEMQYMPSLDVPFIPTVQNWSAYGTYLDKIIDENDNAHLNGMLMLDYGIKDFYANVALKVDYSTNVRHAFYPSTLMESVNFVSDYSGYNRRLMGVANIGYNWHISDSHSLKLSLGGTLQEDRHHYNYDRAFDGDDDETTTTSGGGYIQYRYLDQEILHLLSSNFSADYSFRNFFKLGFVAQFNTSSSVQPDKRFIFTPAMRWQLDLKHLFWSKSAVLTDLNLNLSVARVPRLLDSDRYAIGPQYTSDNIGWHGSETVGAYGGFATASRPYRLGWIGYGIGWPYSDKLDVSVNGSLFGGRLGWNVSFYNNIDKDLLVELPVSHEWGYSKKYEQGMEITNRGVEVGLSGILLNNPKGVTWEANINFAYNKNILSALPDGLSEVMYGDNKLAVGHSVDQFYVLENKGIYTDVSQVPEKNGQYLSVNGYPFQAGDPKWTDINGDNRITDADKVMKGHKLPPFTGGLSTTLKYRRFDLSAFFFFAAGHEALNYRTYQRYDFTTLDNARSLDAVKEVFFWQSGNVRQDLPVYNPLSSVHPYRADQDLYLEDLSYLKLRSVTLGYTFPLKKRKNFNADNLYLYFTADNLFTVSGFSGDDPELVDFDGYYRGYGLPLPRTYTIGLKLKF